jgi:predicted Zn finger-like uncharacterized protein
MSEPKIARKCPQCGEVYLVPLSDRALAEEYFRCAKCGYSEPVGDRNRQTPADEED